MEVVVPGTGGADARCNAARTRAHLCAAIGATGDPRLVFKGGTLLRLCYFDPFRYSADLDFSAIDGLPRSEATATIAAAATACRERTGMPALEVTAGDREPRG
jgi:hypothetical protein